MCALRSTRLWRLKRFIWAVGNEPEIEISTGLGGDFYGILMVTSDASWDISRILMGLKQLGYLSYQDIPHRKRVSFHSSHDGQ